MKPTRFPRPLKERDLADLLPEERLVYHIERGSKLDLLSSIQTENPDVNFDHLLFPSSITDDILDSDPSILPEDTLLTLAVRFHFSHIVLWLVENGADACIQIQGNLTSFHLAAHSNSLELMEFLMRVPGETPEVVETAVEPTPTPRDRDRDRVSSRGSSRGSRDRDRRPGSSSSGGTGTGSTTHRSTASVTSTSTPTIRPSYMTLDLHSPEFRSNLSLLTTLDDELDDDEIDSDVTDDPDDPELGDDDDGDSIWSHSKYRPYDGYGGSRDRDRERERSSMRGVTPFEICLFQQKNAKMCRFLLQHGTNFDFEMDMRIGVCRGIRMGTGTDGRGKRRGRERRGERGTMHLAKDKERMIPLLHWGFLRRDTDLCACLFGLGCSPFVRDSEGNSILQRIVADMVMRVDRAIAVDEALSPRSSSSRGGGTSTSASDVTLSSRGVSKGSGSSSSLASVKQLLELLAKVCARGVSGSGSGAGEDERSSSSSSSSSLSFSPEFVNGENDKGITALERAVFGNSPDPEDERKRERERNPRVSGGSESRENGDEDEEEVRSRTGVKIMELARLLVRSGALVEHVSSKTGLSILHRAAAEGRAQVVAELFQHLRLRTVSLDHWGSQPLHWASSAAVAKVLVEKRADVNAAGDRGMVPLHCAIVRNAVDVVSLLFHSKKMDYRLKSSDLKHNAVHFCASYGRNEAAQVLFDKASPSALKQMIEERNVNGLSPLQLAVQRDKSEMALFLLSHGATISPAASEETEQGTKFNLLRMAVKSAIHEKGMTSVVEEILKRPDVDCIVDQVDEDGRTALHMAILLGLVPCVRIMLASGKCSTCVEEKTLCSPLMLASRGGHREICEFLLDGPGCIVTRVDKDGRTALHYAVGVHADVFVGEEVCRKILDLGLDVDTRDKYGMTPLHAACAAKNLKAVRLLVTEKNADVNALDHNKRAPLHVAVEFGAVYAVRFLIRQIGVPLNALDAWGRSPLLVASETNQTECGRELVKEQSRRKKQMSD